VILLREAPAVPLHVPPRRLLPVEGDTAAEPACRRVLEGEVDSIPHPVVPEQAIVVDESDPRRRGARDASKPGRSEALNRLVDEPQPGNATGAHVLGDQSAVASVQLLSTTRQAQSAWVDGSWRAREDSAKSSMEALL
jgi:hypothetical protein